MWFADQSSIDLGQENQNQLKKTDGKLGPYPDMSKDKKIIIASKI